MRTPAERRKEIVLKALDQFERPLLRYATRLLSGDENSARDAVQHAFMKLCEQQVSDLPDNLAPWLYTVCRNRTMDLLRRTRREPVANELQTDAAFAEEPDPASQLERVAMLRLVQELISQLAHSEREVADLWSQGFSNREIAKVTGRNEGAVRVCLHRAIKSLRQHPAIQRWISVNGIEDAVAPVSVVQNVMGQK